MKSQPLLAQSSFPGYGSARAGQEGVALLLALLLVALLSVIVSEYAYETQVEANLVTNDSADLEAYVAAKSAVASGMALLAGDLIATEQLVGTNVESRMDIWAQPVPMQPINGGFMHCSVDDESGKLNLNAMIRVDESGHPLENELLIKAVRTFFDMRVEALEIDTEENPTDAILDWMDPDDEPRDQGAESEFYSSLEIPYPCKNGALDSLDELLLIRGITPDFFFGPPPEEREKPGADKELPLALTEYLTVHGDLRGRVNVNTAELMTMEALFEAWGGAGAGEAEMIYGRQLDSPYLTLDELDGVFRTGTGDEPVGDVVTLASRIFRVYGDGVSGDARVRIEAYIWRNPGQTTTVDDPIEAEEAFRVLDWRVIR